LLIGAYRDNEANADHPMRLLIERLQRRQVGLTEIKLKPLAESDVCELIADATGERPTRIAPLARVVFEKTHGNPFFVNQFLGVLHAERLLRYDSAAGSWVWQLAQVQARLVTDNVVDLMAGKLQQFAPETQDVLKLASCIGHQFGLHTLSTIHEKGIADTAAALWPALREGLIVPLDSNYRFVHGTDEAGPAFGELPDFKITYKFLHDRVQQAAYALIEEGKKHALHLKIGRLLRASTREAHLEEILF
jgi:predicted ATPase